MKRLLTDVMMLVGGGVVGAGLGLMLAPHAGAKSRKKVVRMGKMMSNKSNRMMRDLSDRVSDLAGTVESMGGRATKLMRIR